MSQNKPKECPFCKIPCNQPHCPYTDKKEK